MYSIISYYHAVCTLLIFSVVISYQSISEGFIDEFFAISKPDTSKFDDYFLQQIENWRQILAIEVITNNEGFNNEDINFLIQRLLNRIVFLRICEDREIEKFETLKNITSYDDLKKSSKRTPGERWISYAMSAACRPIADRLRPV